MNFFHKKRIFSLSKRWLPLLQVLLNKPIYPKAKPLFMSKLTNTCLLHTGCTFTRQIFSQKLAQIEFGQIHNINYIFFRYFIRVVSRRKDKRQTNQKTQRKLVLSADLFHADCRGFTDTGGKAKERPILVYKYKSEGITPPIVLYH